MQLRWSTYDSTSAQDQRVLLWAGLVFALVGAVFGTVGVLVGWSTHEFLAKAAHADGVVIGSVQDQSCSSRSSSHGSSCHWVWKPQVRFLVDGQAHVFVDKVGDDSPSDHPTGQHLTVAYDPDDADDARILRSGPGGYLLPLVFGGFGVLFVPLGVGLCVAWARNRSHT